MRVGAGPQAQPIRVPFRVFLGMFCSPWGGGMETESLEREGRAAGVMMIPIPRAGRLDEVLGMDEARAVPGVEDAVIMIPAGQTVRPLPEGSKYLGFLFARADAPAEVEAALREAHGRLDIRITPVRESAANLGFSPT